jgi:hypothetical protein
MGYCGKCNQHYDCSYTEHDKECEEKEVYKPNPYGTKEDQFLYAKQQQGWSDEDDEDIWEKHFRFE